MKWAMAVMVSTDVDPGFLYQYQRVLGGPGLMNRLCVPKNPSFGLSGGSVSSLLPSFLP